MLPEIGGISGGLITSFNEIFASLAAQAGSRSKDHRGFAGNLLEYTWINTTHFDNGRNPFPSLPIDALQITPLLRRVLAQQHEMERIEELFQLFVYRLIRHTNEVQRMHTFPFWLPSRADRWIGAMVLGIQDNGWSACIECKAMQGPTHQYDGHQGGVKT